MRPRRAIITALSILAVGTIVVPATDAVRANAPFPIALVEPDDPAFDFWSRVSPDGRYALVSQGGTSPHARVEIATGATTVIDGDLDGWLDDVTPITFEILSDTTYRRTLTATGATSVHEVPGLDGRGLRAVGPSDADGRITFVSAGFEGGNSRLMLFDAETGQNLAPSGVGDEPLGTPIDVADDGSAITFIEYCCTGAVPTRYVRRDLASGVNTVVEQPAESDPFAFRWFATADLEWAFFASSEAEVVPGVNGGTARLYRRHVPSGLTAEVPVPLAEIVTASGAVGGRLVFTASSETGDIGDQEQLFVWDGPGAPPLLLTQSPTGERADFPVKQAWVADDGVTVTFISFATNLTPGVTDPDAGHLYQLVLPAISAVDDGAIVAASEEYCVGVFGAEPGDSVVLNITPVLATTGGFGTAHSSDDLAGSTSNVNFGPGTVDPNVAFAQVGANGEVCFTNSVHGPVHVIIDELVVGAAAALEAATVEGADRVIDTRGGEPVAPSTARCFAVNGEPGTITGVNVTPVLAVAPGFGVIHSSDETAGSTSNVNFGPGSFDPNLAFAVIGADGEICFTNSEHGPVHVIVDQMVNGDAASFSSPTPSGAARLIDTRDEAPGLLDRGQRVCVTPEGASAGDWVALNVTPVLATGPGFGTVHSSSVDPGGTSNVNFDVGTVDPNVAIAEVGSDGQVCFSNSLNSETHVIIDQLVNATPKTFSQPSESGAKRLTDTRLGRS